MKKPEKLNSPSSLHSDTWNGLNSTFPPPLPRENVLLLIFSGIQSVLMGPQENLPPFPPFRPLPCFPAFPASPASLLHYFPALPACTVPLFPLLSLISLLSLLSLLSLFPCFLCFPSFFIAISLLFSVHCLYLVLVFPVRFRCFFLILLCVPHLLVPEGVVHSTEGDRQGEGPKRGPEEVSSVGLKKSSSSTLGNRHILTTFLRPLWLEGRVRRKNLQS